MKPLGTIAMHALWLALLTVGAARLAEAQQAETARGVIIEEVRNDQPAFMVRVDVDHPDRIYRHGDEMRVSVVSEKAGYLYLIYCDAEGKMYSLFPNHVDQDNRIPAGQHTTLSEGTGCHRGAYGPVRDVRSAGKRRG